MKIVCLLLPLICLAFASDKPAYRLFQKNQKETAYKDMLKELAKADVVLFGELHNNPICHWLELQVAKDLYTLKNGAIGLGAEMFEADDQIILDEYLSGQINSQQLQSEAKVWNNFATDYKPLVDLAREKKLPFVATNIPRRYASMVARNDWAALDRIAPEAKGWMAPLPIALDTTLPGYANMMNAMGGSAHGNNTGNMIKAQAIKDATMAHFILKHRRDGTLFLHFNGTYHSDNFEGIAWYLKKYSPSLKIATLSSVEQEYLEKLDSEHAQKADYILLIPADMTTTY
jgi:uncharacterized iron-regulated protein